MLTAQNTANVRSRVCVTAMITITVLDASGVRTKYPQRIFLIRANIDYKLLKTIASVAPVISIIALRARKEKTARVL